MSFDPTSRELCPDGACIGVIGPDGQCKECGKVAPSAVSDPRNRGLKRDSDDDGDDLGPADDDRELCPDGACIGLIGPDDRCKECGTPRAPVSGGRKRRESSEGDGGDSGHPGARADSSPSGDGGGDDDEFDQRQLCPDGACIGLIGPDNRCKECGKPGNSARS